MTTIASLPDEILEQVLEHVYASSAPLYFSDIRAIAQLRTLNRAFNERSTSNAYSVPHVYTLRLTTIMLLVRHTLYALSPKRDR